jgi:hypothetical protein
MCPGALAGRPDQIVPDRWHALIDAIGVAANSAAVPVSLDRIHIDVDRVGSSGGRMLDSPASHRYRWPTCPVAEG